MEYDIIASSTKRELIFKINDKISEGWEPTGGIEVICTGNKNLTSRNSDFALVLSGVQPDKFEFMQAMIKIVKPKKQKKEI